MAKMRLCGLLFLAFLASVCSQYDDGIPKYLKTKYSGFGNDNTNGGGDVKTFSHTKSVKKIGYTSTSGLYQSHYSKTKTGYAGGCSAPPPPPLNSALRCSKYSGCRLDCVPKYQLPNKLTHATIVCDNGIWKVDGVDWDHIPACEPICLPECQNNGICVAPNDCNCPEMFSGPQCQFEDKPCLNYPPLPLNSKRFCRSASCTIECLEGHQFPDGSGITNMVCKNGNWAPTKDKWTTVPDCQATCTPPCANGGNCLSFNVCQCPQAFRGPQCQYSVDACNVRKLQFNGGYKCSGNGDVFECSLSCPEGIPFNSPTSSVYTCSYATGKFLPEPIPQCVYGSNVDVVPSGHEFDYYNQMSGSNSFEHTFHHKKPVEEKILNDSNVNFVPLGEYSHHANQYVLLEERTPKPGVCFTWAGTHFKTFDGKVFSFQSKCAHVMVQDFVDNTFNVIVRNSDECQIKPALCYRSVQFFYQDKEYVLKRKETGEPILAIKKKILAIPGQYPGVRVERSGHFIVVSLDSVGALIKWDGQYLVQVEVKESLWNRTNGLCGKIDGNPNNDLQVKNGETPKNVVTLATSWQVDTLDDTCLAMLSDEHACQDDSKSANATKFCMKLLTDKRFAPCHKAMDITVLQDACRWDYCSCQKPDPSECACETLSVYVKECIHKGITALASWRDDSTCPMGCTAGKVYMPCGPSKGQPVCGSTTEISEEVCIEGCYCPEGTVLHESQCITRENCPCRLRGKNFAPGSSVPKDCNTCSCVEGQWVCTQINCGARCSAIGDPHYTTFDGKRFDFMGQCSYYLLKTDNLTIEAENVACAGSISQAMNFPISVSSGLPSCTKTVTIKTSGNVIKLKQNHEVTVNGHEVIKIPYNLPGISIRSASSIFLQVEISSGVLIWWDGLTRAYIDVPATFMGTTKGLCGTFNNNQKDDFVTPENDVEQSVVPFANKWKTAEKCNDMPENMPNNPCDVNIQNKEIALKHCAKLKSDLFKDCHFFVDPETFYQNCLYDMCACENKLSNCLCPIIAAYAQECSLLGVKINWRNQIRECGIHCAGSQKYQICGNSCTRTCEDIASRPECRPQCVEGCNCPEGQALDDTGECIPIGQCNCQHDGFQFPAGYKEIRSASKAVELCTCVNALWSCRVATPVEMVDLPKATDVKEKCSSWDNLEFTTCENPEPTTCKNMHSPELVSASICHAGCQCKTGYVLDTSTKKCVLPSECPCHHGSRSYTENAKVQEDCNTCTCKNGKWNCTDRQCSAECSTWGDSHYKTFDGKLFDYQGQCDYLLAKGFISLENSFDVVIQSMPCSSLGVSCSRSVTVKFGFGPNQDTLTLTQSKKVQNKGFKHLFVRERGLYVIVEAPDFGMLVRWDKGTRVYVKVDPRWKNRLKGLCGNYNNNELDDFQTPSGGLTEVSPTIFGDSWRLQAYCPESVEIINTCEDRPDRKVWALKQCGVLKSSLFAPCHSEVPIDDYVKRCIFDACACDQGGDCECLCTALAAYAQECNNRGVPVKWRSQSLCPIQCDERCSTYSPCVSTCPSETCDSLSQTGANNMCTEDTCIEGCAVKACPEGHVYLNSSQLECVPRSACKILCLEVDGVVYFEGDLVEGDECYSCYCSRGKKVCKGQPCSTLVTLQPMVRTTVQNDQKLACQSGWSEWVNQDRILDTSKVVQKLTEIEPLPDSLTMLKLRTGGRCNVHQMTQIECRTVESHATAKETGLDAECSLETGLICRQPTDTKGCTDFEIRVLCQCEEPTTPTPSTEVFYTVAPPMKRACDINTPHVPHATDCHLFYHCVPGLNGPELIKKTCGDDMYYNPQTQVCDWPNSVLVFKPECEDVQEVKTKDLLATRAPIEPIVPKCPPGHEYNPCLVHCKNLCDYYLFTAQRNGLCKNGIECEEGCDFAEKPAGVCPPGSLWVNNETCVAVHDCLCASHVGQPVKPGSVYRESDCELCQCVDNFYACDKSSCLTTPAPKTAQTEPQINPLQVLRSTVTPPRDCDEKNFINLLQGDAPLPNSAFSASSVLNPHFEPHFAKILKNTPSKSGGSWSPAIMNKDQYIQINLGRQEPVYGVILMGSPIYNEYVTSFYVSYSGGSDSFTYILDQTGAPKKFSGSFDTNTPVKQIFDVPFEAKVVRINPQTWHNGIALRVELIGCDFDLKTTREPVTVAPVVDEVPVCDDPMGVDNGMMSDQQITVSSELNLMYNKKHLKINRDSAWQPLTNSPTEFIQFDFLDERNLTGLLTKGGPNGWVKAFNVKYSSDNTVWNPILDSKSKEKLFVGNHDQNSPQVNHFKKPICARYLKVLPILWNENIQMRVEPFGCFTPYPLVTVAPPIIPPESPCNYCPGVEPLNIELNACQCKETLWWDGQDCVNRTQCPCVVGIMPYTVGAIYEKEDCSQCVCKIGGVSHCTQKVCGVCKDVNTRSVVTSTCECVCKPCEENTRLCPRSGVCINATLWCDGIVHCPDDEVDCVVLTTPVPTSTTLVVPTSTEIPEKKCPEQVCPPGYKVIPKRLVSQKVHSYLSPMFTVYVEKKNAAYENHTPVKSGIKSGSRPSLTRPAQTNLEHSVEDCPEYQCEIVAPPRPPRTNGTLCPAVMCPIGFLPLYNEEEVIAKKDSCPLYTCNLPPPPESVCNVTGRTFNTFDRTEFKYDICNHVLARDLENDEWDVSLKKNCSFACTRDVIVRHQQHTFVVHPDLSIEYDGYKYTVEQTKKIGSQSQFFTISRLGDTLLFISNQYGFWIIWDMQGNVRIGVVKKLIGKVDGLCGYFNDVSEDDKRKPDGSRARTTVEFGDSWAQADQPVVCEPKVCPIHLQNKALEICNKVKDEVFSPCAGVIVLNNFISRCLETTCSCLESSENANATTGEHCKCETLQSFVVDCLTADSTIELTDWRMQNDCPATCEAPFVHHDCYRRKCEPTCQTISVPNACPKLPHLCFPGCYCPAGLVRKDDACIKPSECRDCECNVLPHLQYVTYDGANFTVNGNCVYVMSRDEGVGKDHKHDFQVLITNAPCRNKEHKQCVGKVTILYEGHKVHILYDFNRDNLKVIVDGERVNNFAELEQWATVRETSSKHLKFLLKRVQVEVSIYYPSLGVSVKVPSHKYAGKLEGLCGDCDNDRRDDFRTPSGEIVDDVEEFGLSWLYDKLPGGQSRENCLNKPEETCENIPVEDDPCVQLVDINRFGQCHPLLDPSMFIDWCHKDTCGGRPENACTSIKSYAMECMNYGFCIKWHSELCPADACPVGQKYEECSNNCWNTCEALKTKDKIMCSKKPTEGCFCPEGKVILNNTCVDIAQCEVCDDEGHHSGDTWQKDACTTCSCNGTSLICDTKQCATIDTVCDPGYTAIKVASSEGECCDKFVCVSDATASPLCDPPQELQCGRGQDMKIVTKSDGCQQFVCQCKPLEDCDEIETTAPAEPGYEKFVNTSGCCPEVEFKCNRDLCPKPEACEQFYEQKEETEPGKCCVTYVCDPPKEKCVVEGEYTAAENGGERPRLKYEKHKMLQNANETWHDGPCRECGCAKISSNIYQPTCTKTECPTIKLSSDFTDYTLETELVPNQCCPDVKRVGCKYNGRNFEVGDVWTKESDRCTKIACINATTGVEKQIRVTNCEANCNVGWEYKPPGLNSEDCCGVCKPVACVVDGNVRNVGEKWSSVDHCTHYTCMNINGSLNIQSVLVNCPEITPDLSNNYAYETVSVEGECCSKHTIVACKFDNLRYEVGDSWHSPTDKCKNFTCAINEHGEIVKHEALQTCKTDCKKGWEYRESNASCCGECVQIACLVENVLKMPGENWTSADTCTTYSCERLEDSFTVASHQVSCPNIDDCPVENVYKEGCCHFCNLTTSSHSLCVPQKLNDEKSIGLVKQFRPPHGDCLNKGPIKGFTECVGTCPSATVFNPQTGSHESVCTCCQAVQYAPLVVELVCEDGARFEKQIAVPSECGCESCAGSKMEVDYRQGVKTG